MQLSILISKDTLFNKNKYKKLKESVMILKSGFNKENLIKD